MQNTPCKRGGCRGENQTLGCFRGNFPAGFQEAEAAKGERNQTGYPVGSWARFEPGADGDYTEGEAEVQWDRRNRTDRAFCECGQSRWPGLNREPMSDQADVTSAEDSGSYFGQGTFACFDLFRFV